MSTKGIKKGNKKDAPTNPKKSRSHFIIGLVMRLSMQLKSRKTKRRDRWSRYRERHHSSDEFVVANDPKNDDDDANNNNNNENHNDTVNKAVASMPLRNVTNQRVASK